MSLISVMFYTNRKELIKEYMITIATANFIQNADFIVMDGVKYEVTETSAYMELSINFERVVMESNCINHIKIILSPVKGYI